MALLCLACGAWPTRADTFHFRDSARTPLHGRVLAEFDSVLFVALDGQGHAFLARANLLRVVDSAGRRLTDPAPGTFEENRGVAPAAAVTDVMGEVELVDDEGAAQAMRESFAFVPVGHLLRAGEATLARVVTVTGAVARVAPESMLRAAGPDRLRVLSGELVLQSSGQPLFVEFGGSGEGAPSSLLVLHVPGDSVVACRAGGDQAELSLISGAARLTWDDVEIELTPGQALAATGLGTSSRRITSPTHNVGDVSVRFREGVRRLAPGQSYALGVTVAEEEAIWRMVQSGGRAQVRRGADGQWLDLTQDQRSRLLLGASDGVRTEVGSHMTLSRMDGATLSLAERTDLQRTNPAELTRGRLHIEALGSPVGVLTPGGPAEIRMAMCDVSLEDGEFHVGSLGGVPVFPLGEVAELAVQPQARALLAPGPEDSVQVVQGPGQSELRGLLRRGTVPFRLVLTQTQAVGIRSDERGPELLLAGDRRLRFESPDLKAQVALEPIPTVTLPTGPVVGMEEGLALAIGEREGFPELRFASGPKMQLTYPAELLVHNPTVVVQHPDGETVIQLTGDVLTRLLSAEGQAAMAVGLRDSDRLEIPAGAFVTVDVVEDMNRFDWGTGQRLLIQGEAPDVEGRLADNGEQLFLTMPLAPALALERIQRVTVLATDDGEFVILAEDEEVPYELRDLDPRIPRFGLFVGLSRDRIRDLLDVPRVDSPSGP